MRLPVVPHPSSLRAGPKCERDHCMIRSTPSYRAGRHFGAFLLMQASAWAREGEGRGTCGRARPHAEGWGTGRLPGVAVLRASEPPPAQWGPPPANADHGPGFRRHCAPHPAASRLLLLHCMGERPPAQLLCKGASAAAAAAEQLCRDASSRAAACCPPAHPPFLPPCLPQLAWRYCALHFYERSYESGGRVFETLFELSVRLRAEGAHLVLPRCCWLGLVHQRCAHTDPRFTAACSLSPCRSGALACFQLLRP